MKKGSARDRLRRGWLPLLIAAAAIPVCLLFSRGREAAGQHMEPGYTREEPGQWERTDSLIIGPSRAEGDSVTASAEEGRLIYDFTGAGEHARVTLEIKAPETLFYAGNHITFEFPVTREADTEQTAGDILCMFYLAGDVTERENGAAVSVLAPFKYAYSGDRDMEPVTYAGALVRKDKRYAVANAYFPEGRSEGELLYLAADVSDDRNAGVRTVMAWKYRWKQGPISVEVPPQPGIIEYYRVFGPLDHILRAAAYLLIVLAPALLVRQFILMGKAKEEEKNNGH